MPSVITFALIICAVFSPPSAQAEDAIKIQHLKLLKVLHGDPTPVIAPPALCLSNTNSEQKQGEEFYFGKGDCQIKYNPDYTSLMSPLSSLGEIKQFIYDDKKYTAAIEALSAMSAFASNNKLSLREKIDLQLTLWEMIAGLQSGRYFKQDPYPKYDQSKIDRLIVSGFTLLDKVLLSDDEIEKTTHSEDIFDKTETDKLLRNLYARIVNGEGYFIEDIYPLHVHSLASVGRVYQRIFIGFDDKNSFDAFGKYLVGRENTLLVGVFGRSDPLQSMDKLPPQIPEDLSLIPKDFDKLHTVLITYLNVLNKDYSVIPTRIIAKWAEVWFTKRSDNIKDKIEDIDPNVFFRAIDYQKNLFGSEDGAYKIQNMQNIARLNFLNVNPVIPNIQATTLRGNCVSCHSYRVRDFFVRHKVIAFSKPFVLPFSHYQKHSEYGEIAQARLREWRKIYLH